MRILVDDKIPYIQGEAERLGETVYLNGAAIGPEDVRDCDALIVRTRTLCNRQLLENSQVQFIATATIGFDHLDTGYLAEAGIAWSNCPGCNATSVAQYVGNALLLLEEAGHISLNRCTVGIVGVGHVGKAVKEAVERLGCSVLSCDPPRAEAEGPEGFCTLQEIQQQADVITFHTPLVLDGNHPTFHLADTAFFENLKKRPVIINSSRGETVCTEALKEALKGNRICAAVIDTWENEPHIDRELLKAVFIGTPHIAGYSADGKARGTQMALEAVARHFRKDLHFHITPPPLPEGFNYHPGDPRNASSPLRLYHPYRDSEALKNHPEQFESLRGNYPLRREK